MSPSWKARPTTSPHRLLRRNFPSPCLSPHHGARSLRQESSALAEAWRASRHHRLRAGQQPPVSRRRPRQSRRPRHPAKNHGRRINRGRISRRENDQSLVGQRLLRNFHEARRITRDSDAYGCGSGCARPSAITFSTSSAFRGSFSVINRCPSAVTSTSSSIRTPRFSSRI